jgi:lipoprotein signal peptidase
MPYTYTSSLLTNNMFLTDHMLAGLDLILVPNKRVAFSFFFLTLTALFLTDHMLAGLDLILAPNKRVAFSFSNTNSVSLYYLLTGICLVYILNKSF